MTISLRNAALLLITAAFSSAAVGCSGSSSDESESVGTSADRQKSASRTVQTEEGFRRIFDGETLDGWRRHRNLPSEQDQGGKWVVVNGAIVGGQDPPGYGGFLITTDTYDDFVLKLESRLDYPVDSGIFLRVGETGKSHQITLDYRPEGTVGAVHMALIRGFVHKVNAIEKFKKDTWNDLQVRIEGDPPHIQFWINGEKVTDFQHTKATAEGAPKNGYIAFQVHGGDSHEVGNKVRFRNIRIKELN